MFAITLAHLVLGVAADVGFSPNLLLEFVKSAPSMGAVLAMVYLCFWFISKEREQGRQFYQRLHEEHLMARKEVAHKIEENTVALRDNIVTTTRNTDQVANLSRQIEKYVR